MVDNVEKLKEIKQLLDEGAITEEEFSSLKAKLLSDQQNLPDLNETKPNTKSTTRREGISWPEILAVFFGLMGGLVYLFTKQRFSKKLVVFLLAFLWSGACSSIISSSSNQLVSSKSSETSPPPTKSSETSPPPTKKQPTKSAITPINSFKKVRDDRLLQVNGSEVLESIWSENKFIDPVKSKGGKLIVVYITIKNVGNESGNLFWTDFKLRDQQGRLFDSIEDISEVLTINMWTEEMGLDDSGDQLFPGGTAKTVKVFRVSPDAKNLELVVNAQNVFAIK